MWKKIDVPFKEKDFVFIKTEILNFFPKKYRKDLKINMINIEEKINVELLQDSDKLLLKGGIFNVSIDYHNEEILNVFKRLYLVVRHSMHLFTSFSLNGNFAYNRYTLIGLMARGLAHEINNPLAIISTYTQLLNLQEEKAENREIYKNVLSAVDRASNIVMNISKFAKTEGEMELLYLNNEIKNILEFFENIRKYKFPDILIDFKAQEENLSVMINKNDLYEIVYLILVNACESMRNSKEKQIKITIEKKELGIVLKIKDRGRGISKENMEKLYDPFFSTKGQKNTGLGLSIVKYLIDKNKCNIDIESTYNKWTVVRVIFGGKHENTFGGR
ncbi:GHKL domain-containing protein [bacterium]|nr:GHKL domain-containing protein [bacterium]